MKKLFSFLFIMFFSCVSIESRFPYKVCFGISTLKNIRGLNAKSCYPNQDRALVKGKDGKCFFGVFDGHGKDGADISEYVSENFFQSLLETRRLSLAAETMQKNLDKDGKAQLSGTTAIVGLLDERLLTIGNIGDSRLLYVRDNKILFTTKDHKLSDEKEIERIYDNGGWIEGHYVMTEFSRGLAMTRSLGDVLAHTNNIVSADPTLYQVHVQPGDKMVIASDGLWDVLTNKDVLYIINEFSGVTSLKTVAEHLVKYARILNSKDDITVICTLVE
ncbi:protein phosphatase 2C domain-containing protein [Candidatus Babeliales bacterium]|nr:protein phosphatase 2C domain-containing protein [Candidatus Babeliales bacterium]